MSIAPSTVMSIRYLPTYLYQLLHLLFLKYVHFYSIDYFFNSRLDLLFKTHPCEAREGRVHSPTYVDWHLLRNV
jgi:hypothetical protein